MENEYKDPQSKEKVGKRKLIFRAGVSPVDSNKKIGPIRSHLLNYAFAKGEKAKGNDSSIIFRVDDTDPEKHTKEKAREIFDFFSDVLGFEFDITPYNAQEKLGQPVFQSERKEIYNSFLEKLFDTGVAFLDDKSGLILFDVEKFMIKNSDTLEIDDLLIGKIKIKLEESLRQGRKFFPLVRSDKSILYHLASVVDDGTLGVTHVVRGQDKIPILEFQEMVRIALGFEPKKYLHTPMLLNSKDKVKEEITKFDDFIRCGILPHSLISYMISSGYGDPEAIYSSLGELIQNFDYTKIHKNNGKFDLKKLESINTKLVRKLNPEIYFDSILLYLRAIGEDSILEKLIDDRELAEIILLIRRKPEESLDILKAILNPINEPLREELKSSIKKVIQTLKANLDEFPSAEVLQMVPAEFYASIQWILTGKYKFPSIDVVFKYLKEKDLLRTRVNSTETLLNLNS